MRPAKIDKAEVKRLFDAGHRAADISRQLGCSREYVRQVLEAMGSDTTRPVGIACPRCGRRANVKVGACTSCLRTLRSLCGVGFEGPTLDEIPPVPSRAGEKKPCWSCSKTLTPRDSRRRGLCNACAQRIDYRKPGEKERHAVKQARWYAKMLADPIKRARFKAAQREAMRRWTAKKKAAEAQR